MLKHWPPLSALRGFEAAARLGSFHQAAEELHLTQSAISQQIRSLEAFLEQPLFFRTGRSVALTDAGHDLFSTAQVMLQQLAVGIRRLDQYRKPNQLIVNTTPAFARHWLTPRQRTQSARPALLPMAAVGAARRRITRHVTICYSGQAAPPDRCYFQ